MSTRTIRALFGTSLAAAVLSTGAFLPGPLGTASAATPPVSGTAIRSHLDPTAGRPVVAAAIRAHLDLDAGQMPESIVADRHGSVDVAFAGARQVARIAADGTVTVLATLPAPQDPTAVTPLLGFPLASGLVRAGDTFFVLYATGSAAETGVWTFTEGRPPRRFAALPADGLPNGMVRDGATGDLYITDSARGVVHRVSARGHVTVFSDDPALASTGFFGANGIKIKDGWLYVSNLDKGTVARTPLTGRGAGVFTSVATGLAGIDDFAFTGRGEQFLASLVTRDQVVLAGGGTVPVTVLTAADGLSNPTAVLVRGDRIYVTSAAYTTQRDPNLLVARLARR
ncbi:hypothetical protein [Actinoplanes subglobosus]|uniref:SMP-30/Gluconolactonase/LRE-like region domain-containing protein n=1 Tax=Actinoplanes subglobosus TaxID=1547892 RepID=A0ABV8J237_9ACTN